MSHHFKLTELAAKEEQNYTSHKYTSLLTFIVLRSKVVFEGITQLIQDCHFEMIPDNLGVFT